VRNVSYKDNHEYFGITCGSHYVSSYKVGAVLIMGINVGFKSHYDKETFESKVSGGWGDIFSASHQIK
jgi:hypothetical protein